MLLSIHHSMQTLFSTDTYISAHDVDVRFEAPTKQWVDSLTRPTINFYLFELQENTELRQSNMHANRSNGHVSHRMPPRRFDLRYMVSALTSVAEDEYTLIWGVLAVLVKHQHIPPHLLPEPLHALEPSLVTKVGKPEDSPRTLELWSALDQPPHPALLYTVTVPLDLDIVFESPLVLTHSMRSKGPSAEDQQAGHGISPERAIELGNTTAIGGAVVDEHGTPVVGATVSFEGSAAQGSVTNEQGRFSLQRVPHGSVKLRVVGTDGTAHVETIVVPSDSYEIRLN